MEMTREPGENFSPKKMARIAKELGYPNRVIEELRNCKDETTAGNILHDARLRTDYSRYSKILNKNER